jgi:hypothetical protein
MVVVPFIHGMNRHLDDCYLGGQAKHAFDDTRRWPLLIDFLIFFCESALLFLISCLVLHPALAFPAIGGLLAVDVLWALGAWFVHFNKPYYKEPKRWRETPLPWAYVNIVALALAALLTKLSSSDLFFWLALLAAARTVADYWACWNFYFPPSKANP